MRTPVNEILERAHLQDDLVEVTSATFADWLTARENSSGYEYTRFIFPHGPHPTTEELAVHWQQEVATGKHLLYSIYHRWEKQLYGYVSFFALSGGHCQSNISIFPPTSFGRGLARHAYNLLFPYIFEHHAVRSVSVLVHPQNERAKRLFTGLGFIFAENDPDSIFIWLQKFLG